jgi:hypothetical protein
MPKTFTDIFFLILAVYAVGAILFFYGQANWWRISSWREHRRLDRLIRQEERGQR